MLRRLFPAILTVALVALAIVFAPSHPGIAACSFLSVFGTYFVNIFKSLFGQLGLQISQFLHDFILTDVGKIALDAVAWAASEGQTGQAARDAAKQKLLDDLKAAGKDVEAFSESLLNFFIESAYQAYQAKAAQTGTTAPAQPQPPYTTTHTS